MTWEVSELNKRLLVKALTGAGIVLVANLAQGEWGLLVGALLAASLAFLNKVDEQLPGKKAPGSKTGSWLRHVGV